MTLYGGYDGKGLNHVEVLYQRGDRELAMEFMELLGCTVVPTPQVNETGSTYICVHPDEGDQDPVNNVLYLSEIRPAQHDLEEVLKASIAKEKALTEVVDAYRHKARTLPYGIPHFGLRFPSFESIEPVLERLEACSNPAITDRMSVMALRPSDPEALTDDLIQGFVYTDIVATGLFCLGQVIEMQAQKG
ncbi:MAG: hypothetical protein P8J20_06800 [Novosphingobium sp.]|nr:hypothetical protein [Novosphingobium sp.]